MRKILFLVAIVLCLTGCGSVQTWETLGGIPHSNPSIPPKLPIAVQLPEEATDDVWASGEETMYTCEGYTIYMRTFAAGDLSGTIKTLSGYKPDQLTVMKSAAGEADRYDWVWSSAGDSGDLVCRGAILDDGNYHYSLCVMADYAQAGSLTEEWNDLFTSFRLEQ